MRNPLLAVAVVLLLAGAVAGVWAMRRARTAPVEPKPVPARTDPAASEALDANKVFLSTSSESAKRAALVLPKGPSEDARAVLGAPPVPAVADAGTAEKDYLPVEQVEWVADLELADGASVTTEQLEAAFDDAWREANAFPMLHGLSATSHHWTYVGTAEGPDRFTELKVSWRYTDLDGRRALDAATARRFQQALDTARKKLPAKPARFGLDVAAAERRAQQLDALRSELQDAEVDLVLLAPEGQPFDGRVAWDALSCLGLEWGDRDYFHWVNPNPEAGDDSLFSVGTSTPPGYLLPEQVVKGMKLEDLSFGFFVPRTHDPLAVLEAMLRGAKYAQKRLGGTLTMPDGQPLDEAKLKATVTEAVGKLKDAGFEPGSRQALQLL